MRTTITIQDTLLQKAKEASLARNCTLGEVVEDALRATLLSPPADTSDAVRPGWKTFRGHGLQPGVDLSSSASLLDLMEER